MGEEHLVSYSRFFEGKHSVPRVCTLVFREEDGNNLHLVYSKNPMGSDPSDVKDVSPFIKLNSTMIAHRDPDSCVFGPNVFRYVRFNNPGMCDSCWNELQGYQNKYDFHMLTPADKGTNPFYPPVDLLTEYPKQYQIVEQESQEVREAVRLILEANADAVPTAEDYYRYLLCLRRSQDRFISYINVKMFQEIIDAGNNSLMIFMEQYDFARAPGIGGVLVQLSFARAQDIFDREINMLIRELKRARTF